MKEVTVYVALIMMEFNDEAVCNAFYANYGAPLDYPPKCSMIIRYKNENDLRFGYLNDTLPPPLSRPKDLFDD